MNNPLQSYGMASHSKVLEKDKGSLWNSGYLQPQPHIDQSSMHKFQMFKKFDVVETSYHFYSEKIILHFCDDPGRKFINFLYSIEVLIYEEKEIDLGAIIYRVINI